MTALRSKHSKESDKSILLALVKKRGEKFSTAILEHIEDVGMGKLLEESLKSPRVPKSKIMKLLKSKRVAPRKIKEVDDPEMLAALKATKGAKRVSRDEVFKALRGQA